MEKEILLKEFYQALEGREADIKIRTEFDSGRTRIKMKGPKPLLFQAALEIVEQLALKEEDDEPGNGKILVELLCHQVTAELEEELAGRQVEGGKAHDKRAEG